MKNVYKIVFVILITTFLCVSCTTQKKQYKPKRYKKKDCNCSGWTLYSIPDTKNTKVAS